MDDFDFWHDSRRHFAVCTGIMQSVIDIQQLPELRSANLFFKVENNSLELTRIFKESFRDQRWAWEESVRAEKRDRDAEREKETFRRQRHHQSHDCMTDDGVDAETSLSLSLHLYLSSPLLHFRLTLTFGL